MKHARVLFFELSPFPDGFPPGGGDTLLLLSRDVTARSPLFQSYKLHRSPYREPYSV